MNYLVIDLEMCKVPKLYRRSYQYSSETIQIGAILLDEDFKRIATLSQYIHPQYGVLDNFIETLTGIRNRDIKHAPLLQKGLEHLIDWIGDREYKVYTWSGSDQKQIQHEIKAKHIVSDKINAFMEKISWIDYQAIFGKRFQLDRPYGLAEALESVDIKPEGHFHDGLDDAVNTGLLIEKLKTNPEFQLVRYELPKVTEDLGCTLAEIMAKLQFEIEES